MRHTADKLKQVMESINRYKLASVEVPTADPTDPYAPLSAPLPVSYPRPQAGPEVTAPA